jgi:hypothetical protein
MLGYSARLRIGAAALAVLGLTMAALAACQYVAGTESRESNPYPAGCALPGGTNPAGPLVRFANLVPNADAVDVCIKPSTVSDWGEPIILGGGSDCMNTKSKQPWFAGSALPNSKPGKPGAFGIDYSQVTVPFTAPSQTVDVRVIAAGNTCSDPALTQGNGLKLSTNAVTTLLRFGGADGVPQKIEALGEDTRIPSTGADVRFVHLMPGVGPLDIGLAAGAATSLPTTLMTNFLTQPISFGNVPPVNEPTLEGMNENVVANGYAPVFQQVFHIVAAVHGPTPENAVLLWNINGMNGSRFSVYMAGVPRDNAHPQRGFVCDEASMVPPPVIGPNNPNGNPLLENCTATGLSGISVDVFNTSLYGPNSPAFQDRETAIDDPTLPVLTSPSDIMCLTELDFPKDIQLIIKNSGPEDSGMTPGRFPYSYWVKTSVSTPPTYPNDINGNPPPSPTIPCAAVMPTTPVDNAFKCMEMNCDTTPGDPNGTLPGSTDCLSSHCSGEFAALLLNTSYNACFDCIVDYVASDQPFSAAQMACTTEMQTPYGFGGQLPNLILSRYPLVQTDALVLPSSQYRQGVLYAKVQLEDQQVDFYCGFFSSTLIAQVLPYVGAYGNGGNPGISAEGGAYANEQYLQALDLIKWVKLKSGNNPAIIVGDWRASIGVPDAGPQGMGLFTSPTDLVPGTVGTLKDAPNWTLVAAPGWTPQCTYCPQTENGLNVGQTVGYFMMQPFLYNWGAGAAQAAQVESLIYTNPQVTAGATSGFDAGTQLPLSQYFGLNIGVIRPVH